MPIVDPVALEARARNLGSLNGMRMALVTLVGQSAQLDVYFYNPNQLAQILVSASHPWEIFPISGGHRVRAGALTGMLRVGAIAAGPTADSLSLTVTPIGDYSTYTLELRFAGIDPVFAEIPFKFRPGCFTTDCAPDWPAPPPPNSDPAIDYLAKDYDSFRHVLITAMQDRVTGWTPPSEADLSVVLLNLFSAASDELSDFQDRVMNEAYLTTARKRVSLARHARLMDYYIYEGNQASTLLVVTVAAGSTTLAKREAFFAGDSLADPDAVIFLSDTATYVDARVNALDLYTWSDTRPSLGAGETSADLAMPDQATANAVRDLVRTAQVTQLVLQEHLNPLTGEPVDVDSRHRQLVHLLAGDAHSEVLQDPLTLTWLVRVNWNDKDALKRDYCFSIIRSDGARVPQVSRFHGNVMAVSQGRPHQVAFKPPGAYLAGPSERHYEIVKPPFGKPWAVCALPDVAPLLYRKTGPRGETPTRSTLAVAVFLPPATVDDSWREVSSLVHSDDESKHFVVETDELRHSVIRFGNGINGAQLPERAEVRCWFQSGSGLAGNVGADTINGFDATGAPALSGCWNPFDVTDGADAELAEQIVRNVPEAFRARQLRAVTLADYVARAEELPGVSRAAARYMWTGSWRTVRVTIDPAGTEVLSPELSQKVAEWLEAVRLLGEDIEIRPPEFVPVVIRVVLCATPDTWPEDLRFVLAQEFYTAYAPDGRQAFFHPDAWTFGQALHGSEIEGRLQRIPGVEHVIDIEMRRFDAPTPGTSRLIEVGPSEMIQMRNDPDHMELGSIDFDIRGGRR
jgi:hypothetical protein